MTQEEEEQLLAKNKEIAKLSRYKTNRVKKITKEKD